MALWLGEGLALFPLSRRWFGEVQSPCPSSVRVWRRGSHSMAGQIRSSRFPAWIREVRRIHRGLSGRHVARSLFAVMPINAIPSGVLGESRGNTLIVARRSGKPDSFYPALGHVKEHLIVCPEKGAMVSMRHFGHPGKVAEHRGDLCAHHQHKPVSIPSVGNIPRTSGCGIKSRGLLGDGNG